MVPYPYPKECGRYADLGNRQQQNKRSSNPRPKEYNEAALALI